MIQTSACTGIAQGPGMTAITTSLRVTAPGPAEARVSVGHRQFSIGRPVEFDDASPHVAARPCAPQNDRRCRAPAANGSAGIVVQAAEHRLTLWQYSDC